MPAAAAAAAKSLQSCPTLQDPIDGSPPGSAVPESLQARTLEWVAISFSDAWRWKVKVKSLSRVWLFATPWTAAYQAPPSMGFSRQEYWSWLPLPSPTVSPGKPFKDSSGCLLLLVQTEAPSFISDTDMPSWRGRPRNLGSMWVMATVHHQTSEGLGGLGNRMAFITTQSALTNITHLTLGKLEWDITT